MRISTATIYDAGVSTIGRQQQDLLKTQQQVSTGRRLLTPADDPVASARALDVQQSDALNNQFSTNRSSAKNLLSLGENALQGVTNLLQSVRETVINAGNPVLSDSDRASLAVALEGQAAELLGHANSTDGSGGYLFAGYQNAGPAFSRTAAGVQYNGDQGQRLIQVDSVRQLPATESGDAVFQAVKTGNGTFTVSAPGANTGSAVADAGSVANPAALTGHSYRVDFSVAAGVTTYSVVDTTSASTLSSGNAYVAGSVIAFDGMQFGVTGTPANGDSLDVAPSSNQSIFDTLDNLVAALRTPASSPAGAARLSNSVGAGLANLDRALDHVLDVRAALGARINEADALQSSGDDLGLQYKQTLSQLQDVDYASAISRLTQQQVQLQASQQSFVKISGLSLFNYL